MMHGTINIKLSAMLLPDLSLNAPSVRRAHNSFGNLYFWGDDQLRGGCGFLSAQWTFPKANTQTLA